MKFLTEKTIDYNATTWEDASDYMFYRSKQLLKFGYQLYHTDFYSENDEVVALIYKYSTNLSHIDSNASGYIGIYILEQHRGKGLYNKIYNERYNESIIVTLEECGMEDFLIHNSIPYISYKHDEAYKLIQNFYGDDRAKRSDVPYIYHIDEGLGYMFDINASDKAKQAYSLHPLLQSDEAFNANKGMHFTGISTEVLILTVEYRRVANSYLSTKNKEEFVGFTNDDIHAMLYGDKKQNRKDFLLYHYGTHERSDILAEYFINWDTLLENYKNV